MTHLSHDELKSWFERGEAADRSRVIEHLAECDQCRKSLSALASAETAADTSVPALTVAEAVPLGYAARKPTRGNSGRTGWLRPGYGLAAAAVVVLAVVWLTAPDRSGDDYAIRSSELLGVAPVGPGTVSEFRWVSPFDAARYRITVRDARGGVVFTAEAPASPLAVEQSLRNRLVTGESYSWQVTALDSDGAIVTESRPAGFQFRP